MSSSPSPSPSSELLAFLRRIRFPLHLLPPTTPLPPPTLPTLHLIHRGLQLAVPYENLSVYHSPVWTSQESGWDLPWKDTPAEELAQKTRFEERPIRIGDEEVFRKIVGEGRGGFCLELNGIYAWALKELGFNVRKLSAKVILSIDDDTQPNADRPDSHLVLLVSLPSGSPTQGGYPSPPPPSAFLSPPELLPALPLHLQTQLHTYADLAAASPAPGPTTLPRYWVCDSGAADRSPLEPLPLLDAASCGISGGGRTVLKAHQRWLTVPGWMYLNAVPAVAPTPTTPPLALPTSELPHHRHFCFLPIPPECDPYVATPGVTPDPTLATFERMCDFVCRRDVCPPFPGHTEFVTMAGGPDGTWKLALYGTRVAGEGGKLVKIEYKFLVKDGEGKEVERMVFGGEGAERDWERCKRFVRERFGLEGLDGVF
ncbi:hypothetical protein HDU96_007877 [Phlyctochytrium bullatum]|nr:hypothetical protein HDU96_007877 [Phlyctochytrium bullatum]